MLDATSEIVPIAKSPSPKNAVIAEVVDESVADNATNLKAEAQQINREAANSLARKLAMSSYHHGNARNSRQRTRLPSSLPPPLLSRENNSNSDPKSRKSTWSDDEM